MDESVVDAGSPPPNQGIENVLKSREPGEYRVRVPKNPNENLEIRKEGERTRKERLAKFTLKAANTGLVVGIAGLLFPDHAHEFARTTGEMAGNINSTLIAATALGEQAMETLRDTNLSWSEVYSLATGFWEGDTIQSLIKKGKELYENTPTREEIIAQGVQALEQAYETRKGRGGLGGLVNSLLEGFNTTNNPVPPESSG